MGPLKAPGPAAILATGPGAVDYLAGQQIISGEATPVKLEIQAAFVARRFGLARVSAATIAALTFGEARS